MERVILVDEDDRPVGEAEKISAHREGGRLHRAFSIFVRNSAGELLLQQRAAVKYHFAGRWSNTCCGHPRPGEDTIAAARRRLREEFGLDVPLRRHSTLIYRAHDAASGLTEHEYLHILSGETDAEPRPDPAEIGAWRWSTTDAIGRELRQTPEFFTPWFERALAAMAADHRPGTLCDRPSIDTTEDPS